MFYASSGGWALSTSTVIVENGAIFTNAATSSTSVAIDIFRIHGGGTYYHNSSLVPIPGVNKQFANSTNGGQGHGSVIVQSFSNSTSLQATFGNLTITYTNTGIWSMSTGLAAVEGDFIFNTNSSFPFRLANTSFTFTIGGDFHLLSGLFQVSNNTMGTYALNIGGNFYQAGGTFTPNTNTSTVAINFIGSNNTFNQAGGTFTNTLINWKVNSGASLSLLSNLPVGSSRTLTIDGSLNCGTNKITGAGSVSVSASGTLGLGSLNPAGALADNVTATLNSLPSGAAIEYNGSGTQYETSQIFQDLIVTNSSGLSIGSGVTLQVKGDLVNNGLVTGGGKLVLNNSSGGQGISGNGSVSNLEIDNAAGVTIASGSSISITDSMTLTAGTLTTNDGLVLKSSSVSNTARVHPLGLTAAITGKVTVERYIPARRAWRLLTAPVKGATNNSIFYNWQHNGGPDDGTGVEIWGPGGTGELGNGLANTAAGTYSMRTYDGTANAWVPVTNTQSGDLFNGTINKGLLSFVSGPYASGNISSGATATTLRATGELITGPQQYVFSDALALIGNPYVSPISFDNVWNNAGNVNLARQFWVVDPNLNDVGGYVLVMHNGTGYSITPSGAGTTFQDEYIQNGQAFFVAAAGPGQVTMNIDEDDKATSTTQTAVFRTNGGNMETLRVNLNAVPQSAPATLIDGALVNCHQNYNNSIVTGEDGTKFFNFNESISLIRNGSKFAIEGRPLLDQGDTIRVGLNGMRQRSYQLELVPAAFNAPGLTAILFDNYLNTTTPISLSANTVYPFAVNAAVASGNDARFFIVFSNSTPLDLNQLKLSGERVGQAIELNWQLTTENNIAGYQVERSGDGKEFTEIRAIVPSGQVNYSFMDERPLRDLNYYRIGCATTRGNAIYSKVLIVKGGQVPSMISLHPNPVTGSTVRVQMNGTDQSGYTITVTDMRGLNMYSSDVPERGSSNDHIIDVGGWASGIYMVTISNAAGEIVGEEKLIITH
jgi:hypothetical protein